jgi:hypothetical protein
MASITRCTENMTQSALAPGQGGIEPTGQDHFGDRGKAGAVEGGRGDEEKAGSGDEPASHPTGLSHGRIVHSFIGSRASAATWHAVSERPVPRERG